MADCQMATSKDYLSCFFCRDIYTSSPLAQVAETWNFDAEDPSLLILLLKPDTDESGEATHAESKLSLMGLQFPQVVSEVRFPFKLVLTKMWYKPQISDMIIL